MELQLLGKNKESNVFSISIKNVDISFVNTIRRLIMSEVPTMAIESCEFRTNDSALYDEILAHRLGLLILNSDIKAYTLPSECNCKGEGCAKCQVSLTLKAKGEKIVYAGELKSQDPKIIPVHEKTILVELLKGQNIELIANAVLGTGKQHVKWSPGHVHFKNNAKIIIHESDKLTEFKDRYPEQIFDSNGDIDKAKILELDLVDACDGVCDDILTVEYNDSDIIMVIENWGQLENKELGTRAADILELKCEEFIEKLKIAEVS